MLRTAWAWTIGIAYTLFWSTLGMLTWPLSPSGDVYLRYARIWSRWILGTLGIPLDVHGRERLDPDATYLFMSNHESTAFDVFALFVATEHGLRMVAKRVLFFIPVFGWSLWMCGFIPINRRDREQAIRSLQKAAERIRAGTSVLVFPEGTRSRTGELLPFKKGGFMLAIESGAPIVPIVVKGTRQIMPAGSLRVGKGRITVRIGAPIATAGLEPADRETLMARVRAAMERLQRDSLAATGTPA